MREPKIKINKSVTVLIQATHFYRYISEVQYWKDANESSRHLISIHEEKEGKKWSKKKREENKKKEKKYTLS